MTTYTATYSPEDNKLRLSASERLDAETYARIKSAGFIWAPKQGIFVAPMWTPGREDILLELAGEIEDEDKSLVERQEERADRFENYSEKRREDAEHARQAVAAIADNIPFGQPILVGHHSERHARKDAERIDNGMRQAVKMWETADYWERRAAGAIRHAKYKERPDVRARRIKGIEADKRKKERDKEKALKLLELWNSAKTIEQARYIAGRSDAGWLHCISVDGLNFYAYEVLRPDEDRHKQCPAMTLDEVKAIANKRYPVTVAWCERWIRHFENRLAYETAMLEDQGAADLIKPKPKPEQLPLVNYRAPEVVTVKKLYGSRGETETLPQVEMTKAEYAKIWNDYKGTRIVENSHRIRTAMIRNPGQQYGLNHVCIFLTDSKEHKKPQAVADPLPPMPNIPDVPESAPAPEDRRAEEFKAMKEALKTGVKTVSAPQLFPTPPEIAAKMVELAELEPGLCVLEPSAGTGNIIKAVLDAVDTEVLAYEINSELCGILSRTFPEYKCQVRRRDFLEVTDFQGCYPRIIMNPPFQNAEDIKHIRHALTFLKPGGRLVALCANGPRQREAFRDMAVYWEDLPPGSFKEQGTSVNVALMVLVAAA